MLRFGIQKGDLSNLIEKSKKMKKLIISILFMSSIIAAFGQQPEPNNFNQPVQQTVWVKNNYQDAFLSFTLEKVKKYSEVGEQAIEKAIDSASKEAPILCEEYLRWNFWKNILKFLAPMCGFFIFGGIYIFIGQKINWNLDDHHFFGGIAVIISAIVSCFFFLITLFSFDCLLTAIQIHIAPRVFLLEQVMNLVK